MDCLVLPIQSRVEEWKKITNILDKEHHKGNHEVLRFSLKISLISITYCTIYFLKCDIFYLF